MNDIECYNCMGRGIVYEVEPYPEDPDDVGVDAESCDQCAGVGRLQFAQALDITLDELYAMPLLEVEKLRRKVA